MAAILGETGAFVSKGESYMEICIKTHKNILKLCAI